MIRKLSLRGWKAFDSLDLELQDGVTFVVARNGVGKTSIVEAASWGMFGGRSGVDGHASRRSGHDEARVSIEVVLPDGKILILDRRLRSAEATHHTLDGIDVSDKAAANALVTAFGATLAFLSKTAIVPSSLMLDEQSGSGYLRDHLAEVFGVAQLEAAAAQLEEAQEQADEEAAAFRKSARSVAKTLAALKEELSKAEQDEESALLRRTTAEERARLAEERLVKATREAEAAQRAAAAADAFTSFAARSRAALEGRLEGVDGSPDSLLSQLAAVESNISNQVAGHREANAALGGRIEGITSAARQLASADAVCPVCRRAMSKDVAAQAEHAHAQDIAALDSQRAEIQAALAKEVALLTEIRELRAAAPPLPEPVAAQTTEIDLEQSQLANGHARSELMSIIEELGAARANKVQLHRQVGEAEQDDADSAASLEAHRKESAAAVAAESMRLTAHAILRERIDPLVAEVRNRWKRVHADRGSLTLLPDGRMVLTHGQHTIEFAHFSSGEKVIALLEARMLVLAASTRASFLWLDEPLEHLDAISRRAVASLLATGTAGQSIRQIVVTTYEEELARTFEASEDSHLIWVDAQGSVE